VRYYFDTSALCRYYHAEPGSPKVESIIQEPRSTHVLSWLTILETQSAFALKVRTGEIVEADFAALVKRLRADIAARRFLVTRVLRRHFDCAERLIRQYGLRQRLRSLDALHLGVALDLHEHGHIDTVVSTDATLLDVGQKEGLPIINPLAMPC
jgi:predicted nucleic acid-binding protein